MNSDKSIIIKKSGKLMIKGKAHMIIGTQNDKYPETSAEVYRLRDEVEKEGIPTNWKDADKKDTADLYVKEENFKEAIEIKKKLTCK